MPEGYYYVKKWWKHQHYRDRNPPWIKLYKDILHDKDIQSLKIEDRWRLINIWVLASEHEGSFDGAKAELRRSLGLATHKQAASLLARVEATGLISQQDIRGDRPELASKLLHQRQRQIKKSTETDKIVLSLKKKEPKKDVFVLPDWIPDKTWKDFIEMRTKIRKPPTDGAKELLVRKLEKLKLEGFSPVEVLEQSILKCWQDVFPIRPSGGLNSVAKRELSVEDREALELADSLHRKYHPNS